MPPRKPSPVGAHVFVSGGLVGGGLAYADEVGAEAVQVFVSNPRGWAAAEGDARRDEEFRTACAARRTPVFVHATYLVNLGSPTEATRLKSAESLRAAVRRGRRIGARGVVFHAGSAVDPSTRQEALHRTGELLRPLLDELADEDPDLLVEPMAGGGGQLVSQVAELAAFFAIAGHHAKLGVCLDTCHLHAAGHDLARPGGVRATLNALVRTVGRGRLRLVHANDAKDACGSGRDRHVPVGEGTIGVEPFAELFRHPATRGVPVIVETPGKAPQHRKDLALLKSLRDR